MRFKEREKGGWGDGVNISKNNRRRDESLNEKNWDGK